MVDHSRPADAADLLEQVLTRSLETLRQAPAPVDAWDAKAGPLEWTCWETGEHLADDLFAYAAQLAEPAGEFGGEVPFRWIAEREDGPANTIHADRAAGRDGMLRVLAASGALLASMTRTTPPDRRAHHGFGATGPRGFALMGAVETLVHTHDLAAGLRLTWTPPEDACETVLAGLFPAVPRTAAPWPTLLWATGRAPLPDRPRLTDWRWHNPA